MNKNPLNLTFIALFTVLPALASAAPKALLEKSQTYVFDNQIKTFQAPIFDIDGKLKYYDLTVTLTINDDGTVSPIADVVSKVSPSIKTRVLVPGTYKSTQGDTTCKITNMTLTNGRIQSFLNCNYTGSTTPSAKSELSVATGGVTAGHPFFAELVADGINKRADVDTQTWGNITNGDFAVGSCKYYNLNYPISVKTTGNAMVISVYGSGTPSVFRCSGNFTKQ